MASALSRSFTLAKSRPHDPKAGLSTAGDPSPARGAQAGRQDGVVLEPRRIELYRIQHDPIVGNHLGLYSQPLECLQQEFLLRPHPRADHRHAHPPPQSSSTSGASESWTGLIEVTSSSTAHSGQGRISPRTRPAESGIVAPHSTHIASTILTFPLFSPPKAKPRRRSGGVWCLRYRHAMLAGRLGQS